MLPAPTSTSSRVEEIEVASGACTPQRQPLCESESVCSPCWSGVGRNSKKRRRVYCTAFALCAGCRCLMLLAVCLAGVVYTRLRLALAPTTVATASPDRGREVPSSVLAPGVLCECAYGTTPKVGRCALRPAIKADPLYSNKRALVEPTPCVTWWQPSLQNCAFLQNPHATKLSLREPTLSVTWSYLMLESNTTVLRRVSPRYITV